MKILFICDYGRNRSVVGSQLLRRFLNDSTNHVAIESNGLAELRGKPHADIRERLKSYHTIFCMDEKARTKLRRRYRVPPTRIINLNIPDLYDRHVPEDLAKLEALLTHKIRPYMPMIRRKNE